MPRSRPREFREDVVAVARRGKASIGRIAKDFGIRTGAGAGAAVLVAVSCRVPGLFRPAYYAWLADPISCRDLDTAYLTNAAIDMACTFSRWASCLPLWNARWYPPAVVEHGLVVHGGSVQQRPSRRGA